MNKSLLCQANNPGQELVTAQDVGKLVDVSNVGKGFLRYVGSIHGKEGIFCGIELLEPNGKHDGTFQGISYFIATPQHGIFAPIFRVNLDRHEHKERRPKVSPSENRLSRSALPALDLCNPLTRSPSSNEDVMMKSAAAEPISILRREADPMQMSMYSDMMDGSMLSNGSWSDIAESMITSNCTFTVRKGISLPNDDDMDLMSVPMVQSVLNIDREALRREEQLQSSFVLGESRIGVEHLPIIEDVDEMETPLVENRPKSTTMSSKADKKTAHVAAPPAPKFPVKPRPPSKHQLMMEQLKASIEAEKNKPKKEIKSRVSLFPPPPPPKQQNENREGETVETPRKSSTRQPLKSVHKIKSASTAPVERPKRERKPLYVPPPPKERVEKEKLASKITKPQQNFIPVTKKEIPMSGCTGKTQGVVNKNTPALSVSKKVKPQLIDEKEKLIRLQKSCLGFEALSIVISSLNDANTKAIEQYIKKLEHKSQEVADLRKRIDEATRKFQEDVDRLAATHLQVAKNHAQEIENLKKKNEQQLAQKIKEFEVLLDDEKARRDAEMFAMSNRHQKVVACLDEKIAESEKQCEQLKLDKKTLQTALSNDCDQRNQMLTKEISSLQTAMEMKSAEMKELRQKNQNLSLQVDEIPLKELEISKWRHKANEYKQILDQKINGEKILVQQIEELRKKQIHDDEEKEAMKRSLDLMQFKYENGNDQNVLSFCSAPADSRFGTPTKVQFRSKSSASTSGSRPPSMNMPGEQDPMIRSTLSMYTSQIRLPENHATDVIYAPDEIISSRSGSISQRLSIAVENESDPTLKIETYNPSDSGIGMDL
ncbi:unnamed protein product [Caenorhabditis bovis]|uniref:CAP-Gly domain-containing protein n=1 Tax=Caenorhabditis bovis TaxID=2654633 RepID=A0A8S1EKB4_9PELO|nr:unnamed protein product [Caenorhabditis bovis]